MSLHPWRRRCHKGICVIAEEGSTSLFFLYPREWSGWWYREEQGICSSLYDPADETERRKGVSAGFCRKYRSRIGTCPDPMGMRVVLVE